MANSRVQGYMTNSSEVFFSLFPPSDTNSGTVTFIMDWAANVLRSGSIQAVNALDIEERKMIIASVNNFSPDTRMVNFAHRMSDWFVMDEGLMWDWSQKKISVLIKKLTSFTPSQTMGLILWAKTFYADEDQQLDVYVTDFSRLFEQ
jgi:hypothetical protein